jgi:hypothetical protein
MSTAQTEEGEVGRYDKHIEEENVKIANRIAMERTIRIDEAARKLRDNNGEVSIRLRIPTGEVENAFGEKQVVYKEGEYETKSYKFRKIATSDWNLYTLKRAELQNESAKPITESDQNKIADLNNRIYEYLALKYLGVPHNDYIRAEWDDIKLAVEACNMITENANVEFEFKSKKKQQTNNNNTDEELLPVSIPPFNKKEEGTSPKKTYDYED